MNIALTFFKKLGYLLLLISSVDSHFLFYLLISLINLFIYSHVLYFSSHVADSHRNSGKEVTRRSNGLHLLRVSKHLVPAVTKAPCMFPMCMKVIQKDKWVKVFKNGR